MAGDAAIPALVDPEPLIARATTSLRRTPAGAGDRVLVVAGNDPSTFGVLAACCLAGVVPVPVPPDLPAAELRSLVADADPVAAFVGPDVRAREVLDELVTVGTGPGSLDGVTATEPPSSWPRTRPMAYTSGTTGARKGVTVGLHDESWGRRTVTDEHDAFDRRHGDRALVVSPLYHSAPFRFALATALHGGRIAVLPRFDAALWRTALREIRPTSLFCVPTHLHRLLDVPGLETDDLASLDLLAHAGAPCPRGVKERVLDLAPDDSVWEFYGATEGQFTVCPPGVWRQARGTVGHARPGHRLEIRPDPDAAADERGGTVWVHAPTDARWEYWRDPVRTADAWDGDAFTVGDLGELDDAGRLTLLGRPGDLVITGGVNVYPAEVERVLLAVPGVAEAIVFGVPDGEWGERVVAAVVPADASALDGEDVRATVRGELAAPQVPKRVVVVDELPRTATGKLRRRGIADALAPVLHP